jgi:hypothetical protein
MCSPKMGFRDMEPGRYVWLLDALTEVGIPFLREDLVHLSTSAFGF